MLERVCTKSETKTNLGAGLSETDLKHDMIDLELWSSSDASICGTNCKRCLVHGHAVCTKFALDMILGTNSWKLLCVRASLESLI